MNQIITKEIEFLNLMADEQQEIFKEKSPVQLNYNKYLPI